MIHMKSCHLIVLQITNPKKKIFLSRKMAKSGEDNDSPARIL